MLDKLNQQIHTLENKRQYLESDWQKDEHPLMNFYIKIMPLALNAERCGIFIFDPDKKIIWLKAGTGLQEREIQVTGEFDSVVGKVISSGQHIIVSGLDKEHGIHKQTDEITGFVTRDILCTPIKSLDGRRVMGAVQLLNKKDGKSFNDDDLSLINEMAHYLELTIENIYFNQEVTSLLKDISATFRTMITTILWIVGVAAVVIIGRTLWVGISH